MPTKQHPRSRAWHQGRISPEAVALFAELEAVPSRRRSAQEFKQRSRELARMLGLEHEWFVACCDVHDTSNEPCWPPDHVAVQAWHRVRAVRRQLLAAVMVRADEDRPVVFS
jgi:non-ribosomal peptide synthetase component F